MDLELRNVENNVELDKDLKMEIKRNENAFLSIVQNVVGKGADYVIKAMPVSQPVKNVLLDVRQAFETKDFKNVVKTAINSSINEGLKVVNMPVNVLRDVTKVVDISFKGGLKEGVAAAIDIVSSKYLKNNIYGSFIKDFIDKTKGFIYNKEFDVKINNAINKILDKVDKFKEKCEKWYESYNNLDFDKINDIANQLNKEKAGVKTDLDCIKQNDIIQNITKLVNVKKEKLSDMQMEICSNI